MSQEGWNRLRFKMDKKAYYNFDDIGMFIFIAIIVTIAIVVGVLIFYGTGVDIRKQEAVAISNRLVDVFSNSGYLNKNVLTGDILDLAGLDKEKFSEGGDFYFGVEIYSGENFDEFVESFFKGTKDFRTQCELKGKHFPDCYKREFIVLDKDSDKKYKIKILTASNQLGSAL